MDTREQKNNSFLNELKAFTPSVCSDKYIIDLFNTLRKFHKEKKINSEDIARYFVEKVDEKGCSIFQSILKQMSKLISQRSKKSYTAKDSLAIFFMHFSSLHRDKLITDKDFIDAIFGISANGKSAYLTVLDFSHNVQKLMLTRLHQYIGIVLVLNPELAADVLTRCMSIAPHFSKMNGVGVKSQFLKFINRTLNCKSFSKVDELNLVLIQYVKPHLETDPQKEVYQSIMQKSQHHSMQNNLQVLTENISHLKNDSLYQRIKLMPAGSYFSGFFKVPSEEEQELEESKQIEYESYCLF